MRLCVALDARYSRTPDGAVWTEAGVGYDHMAHFLSAFDEVLVITRVLDLPEAPQKAHRLDGKGVSVAAVPFYLGPQQYLLKVRQIRRAVRRAVGPRDAVLLYGGAMSGTALVPILRRAGHPYAVHVVGDPYDVFSPGAIKHPLRRFFRWMFTRQQQRACAGACAALYVTKQALQRRYPCSGFSMGVSDVEIPDAALVAAPREPRKDRDKANLVFVGQLAHLYKAPEVLIDAVGACIRGGLDLRLAMIGDGKHRASLEERAAAAGIAERVQFLGQIPSGEAVRSKLDQADLFILPSRQEGLPRAMVEAMARALPCIGSTVGGIPELLPAEDMVEPGDAEALAAKIREVVTDPDRMARMSARSLETAREYRAEELHGRRIEFFRYLRERTEDWLKSAKA